MKIIMNVIIAACFLSVSAGEIIIQNGLNGYNGCVDTYITQPGKGGDESNHGKEPILRMRAGGWPECPNQRVAIKFDNLDEILGNYTIKDAYLELYYEKFSYSSNEDTDMKMFLRLLSVNWDEDYATWFDATSTSSWNTEGVGKGDIDIYVKQEVTYDGVEEKIWHKFDLFSWKNLNGMITTEESIIQRMIDKPNKNFGIFIRGSDAREFIYTSSEGDNPAHRPRLRVIVDEPVGIDGIESNTIKPNITLDRNNKLIKFMNVEGQDLSVKIYSSNGVSVPVKLTKLKNSIVCSYGTLSKGVYFVRSYTKANNLENVTKIVTY